MRGSLVVMVLLAIAGFVQQAPAIETRHDMTLLLRDHAEVCGPEILLSDLADLSEADRAGGAMLARIPLGSSPMPGETRILTRTEITRILEMEAPAGFILGGADQVRVSRTSRPLLESEIAPLLQNHVASITGWHPDNIRVRAVRNLKGVQIPEGDVAIRPILASVPTNFRNVLAPLEVSVGGRPVRTVWVTADIRISATLLQAARALPFGTVLSSEDVRPVQVEISDSRASYPRNADAVVGKVLRRGLKPGQLITEEALAAPVIVRSGQTVRLRFEKPNIRAAMLARAEQNGRMGQSIRVRNLQFASSLNAVVVGPGEVLIQ